MSKPKLYTTPFVVAWVLLILGLLSAFNPAYFPLIFGRSGPEGGNFAFMIIGILVAVVALTIFGVYGKLNADFQKMLAGDTLLTYVMPFDIYRFFRRQHLEDLKGGNRLILFVILGFVALIGIIFGLAVDPLFFLICLGIAVFFTVVFFIVTSYRTGKLRKSQALVCLNAGGVYIFGEMHSWSLLGSWPVAADLIDPRPDNLPCPCISISYMTPNYPLPQQFTVTIPVPPPFTDQGLWAVNTIKGIYGL
jgi:hypothetical protein